MNMIEKILAKASDKREVSPGDVVVARVDLMVMHDLSANFVMKVFENEMQEAAIADPSRIAFVFDHNFAPATQAAAEALAAVREFAARHQIRNVFDCGCGSVHHVIIESGLWAPGKVIIGCDSHTPIYGALGAFATGVGNNSMAALGFARGLAWLGIPQTIQIVLHGKTQPCVTARDVSQYLVGYLGEDGAIYLRAGSADGFTGLEGDCAGEFFVSIGDALRHSAKHALPFVSGQLARDLKGAHRRLYCRLRLRAAGAVRCADHTLIVGRSDVQRLTLRQPLAIEQEWKCLRGNRCSVVHTLPLECVSCSRGLSQSGTL